MNRIKVGLGAFVIVTALVIAYGLGRAGASGIPQTGTLVYSGTLLTFGQADNNTHLIGLTLFQSTGTQTSCVISATSIQVTNGQFSVPLPESCVTVIHTYSGLDVQVNIDGTAMGMQPLSAVPYAVEADTATEMVTDTSGGLTCSQAGHMRWTGTQFQGCNGTNWVSLQGSVGTSGNAGASCMDILTRGGSSGSGFYYIDPIGYSGSTSAPFMTYCDMSDNGGGYTLILRDSLIESTILAASAVTWTATTQGNIASGGDYWVSLAALQAMGKSGSSYDYLAFSTGTESTPGQWLRCTQSQPITTQGAPSSGSCAYQDGSTSPDANIGVSFHTAASACQNISWWGATAGTSWWGGSMFCDVGTCVSCTGGEPGGWGTQFPNVLGVGSSNAGIPRASDYTTWILSR